MATIYFVTRYNEDYDDRRGGDYPVNGDGSECYRLEVPDTFYGRKRLAQEVADRFNQKPGELEWQKKSRSVKWWPDVRYRVEETELIP